MIVIAANSELTMPDADVAEHPGGVAELGRQLGRLLLRACP